MTVPAPIPTVVVHLYDTFNLEAVCADVPVRVILVDYGADATDEDTRTVIAPDGDTARIWSKRLGADPDQVLTYTRAAGLPDAPKQNAPVPAAQTAELTVGRLKRLIAEHALSDDTVIELCSNDDFEKDYRVVPEARLAASDDEQHRLILYFGETTE